MTPTEQLYQAIERMYDHFNCSLFDNSLPSVVLTMQKQKRVMGYFSPSSWASSNGLTCHEIAVNPDYIASFPLIEVMQTLVHEQVHCWQVSFGRPSRSGYHNKEWAEKMVSIGLIPSSTGEPGGAMVGQKMADYPEPRGLFIRSCETLVKEGLSSLPWVAVKGVKNKPVEALELGCEPEVDSILCAPVSQVLGIEPTELLPSEQRKKTKYSCPLCNANVWGKNGLNINCGNCEIPFLERDE